MSSILGTAKIKQFPESEDLDAFLTKKRVVKLGIDPTFPSLHIGHLVPLRIARKLQDAGHEVILVLGTFTATLGDPTGREKTRPILDSDEVARNAKLIHHQLHQSVFRMGVPVVSNSDCIKILSAAEFIRLTAEFTTAKLLSRVNFRQRGSVGLHELLVPLAQAWDSVVLKAEVEIGGEDQLFNFELTRELQHSQGQVPQICLMTPIIRGTDGRKMSKTFGNCIFFDDHPNDVFGKVMSISDEVMDEWIPLFVDDVSFIMSETHPKRRKALLAWEITQQVWGTEKATEARKHFESVISDKGEPEEMTPILDSPLVDAVVAIRECSKTEAGRLLKQGAVKVNGTCTKDGTLLLQTGDVVKVGPRHFGRVV